MTHSLHRAGDAEGLSGDFVIFAMTTNEIDISGSAERLRRFCEVVERYGPVNCGDIRTGSIFGVDRDELFDSIHDNSIVHFVFDQRDPVEQALLELRSLDLGISIVVTGLFSEVEGACSRIGLLPHTIAQSCGIHGNRARLPEPAVLELTTMCGHGMVASGLARKLIEDVRRGEKTPAEAANALAKPCHCGIFNPRRAEGLVRLRAQAPDSGQR